jgi:NAD(P)-dependent dehydrogenase (short-subunit alcohol dehydrogenase family)
VVASGFVNLRNAESNPIAIAKLPLVEQIEPTFTDRASPQDATMELWDTLFAANGRAAFFLMQRFCHPSEGWGPGSVVNILSINAPTHGFAKVGDC